MPDKFEGILVEWGSDKSGTQLDRNVTLHSAGEVDTYFRAAMVLWGFDPQEMRIFMLFRGRNKIPLILERAEQTLEDFKQILRDIFVIALRTVNTPTESEPKTSA